MSAETDEYRKKIEDEVMTTLANWCRGKQLIGYHFLYNLGIRSDGILFEIEKWIREECKKNKAT